MRISRLEVEDAPCPLGLDEPRPRFSWVVSDGDPVAYQVVVDDVWDSGRVASDRTFGVEYDGPTLTPSTRYQWRVRVWPAGGDSPVTSEPSWWETGMLGGDWGGARWIGAVPWPAAALGLDGAGWLAVPPDGARYRGVLTLPAGRPVRRALVAMYADDFRLSLGWHEVLGGTIRYGEDERVGASADVTELVRAAAGSVVLTVRANPGREPAVLAGRLWVEFDDGATATLVTGPHWTTSSGAPAPVAEPPPGPVVVASPERPAPLLRRSFTLPAEAVRARLSVAGLAYHEVHLGERRVGSAVLDPGFTAYDRTVLYATHDVTDLVAAGPNVVTAELGRGFHGLTTPTIWWWHRASWHGEPRLLFRLVVTHADGSETVVVSDGSWEVADGPTRSDSLYTGETYDARRVGGETWGPAAVLPAPAGRLVAQQHEPIRVTETVRPVSVTSLSPGRHVLDFGRTMAGRARIAVDAPAGRTVTLTYAEQLASDGTVAPISALVWHRRFQRDEYVAAGEPGETWEPRFTYKGFRYLQVDGVDGVPAADAVVARILHSDVATSGEFGCSEPLYERLHAMMHRTVVNNLHGIPTDTPLYEKNGWTGDVQVALPTLLAMFDLRRLLAKWAGDLADAQRPSGALPVVVPSGGWGYEQLAPSPEWTTVYPYLVRELYRAYGDERLVARHWAGVTRYLDWELGRLDGDGLATSELGDWLAPGYVVPPEDRRLTATAYLHRALEAAAELGGLVGDDAAAPRYRDAAAACRDALNATFLDRSAGVYRTATDPGYRQTSNAVPLAFGLVPPEYEQAVADGLAASLAERGDRLDTGCLGTSVLLPVLTRYGHGDRAHAVVTQPDEPGWRYWIGLGADTMWESWKPDSRSRGHYFLGTVVQWLYEHVAGLRPGDAGFARFVVRPDARGPLTWARAVRETVRGRASVAWSRTADGVQLEVEVPAGATAEVHVPVGSDVGDAWRVRTVGAGRWRFHDEETESL
ncbi:alpha-L-rhamnosidase [Jiangella mangrovi]|uniref:alpha-L-rhamnosidase n=1 Tax=Jiangella mangrovi TaxID=1524084 RepID=A0A7W9GKT2_9ACTN|nr:alpha-L-rhamnosidase [Jiangella mangrovi]MBB5785658.1 alpha-L-rhamnosidase [Jiangella mangrovi]